MLRRPPARIGIRTRSEGPSRISRRAIRKTNCGHQNFKLRGAGGMRIILCEREAGPRQCIQTSGADNFMKCAGCRCSFGLSLVLGAILLSAAPLTAQQTPAPAVMPSFGTPLILSASLSEPAPTVSDKLAQLDKDVKAAQSSADN